MSDYVIYKKVPCDYPPCIDLKLCRRCQGKRYTLVEVDLLDVLAKVRWNTPVFGHEHVATTHSLENVYLEDE